MSEKLEVGTRVQIQLDDKFGEAEGWHTGIIVRVEPYSAHRSFYWVELSPEAQTLTGLKLISVFNPKNINSLSIE